MNYYFDALKKYADFNGRARRKEYWMFFLFNMIIGYALLFLGTVTGILMVPYFIFAFATLLPSIAVGVRRMHDVGKSGWYVIIPIYNLILACTDGQQGPNEYGSDPKGFGEEINEIGTPQE